MNIRFGPIGPRGLALLAAAGIVGLILGAHGWAHRAGGGALGSLNSRPASAQVTPTTTPSSSARPTAGPTAGPGASAQPGAPGPTLASQSFAQYAFAIWPGTPSAAAKAALTGLSVNVHQQPTGLSITAGVNGQQAGQPRFYLHGVHVYVVEASMGDDSGSSEYNLGDDGLVVTDSHGRIIS
jgi:hypothetical protein